jgi:hypothetical protein
MFRNGLAITVLLITTAGAVDAVAAPKIKLLGFDDGSCQAWLASKDDPEVRNTYIAWTRGFLSGHNYAHQSRQVTDISSGTVANYIERFCRENPKGQFTDAAYRMSDDFSGRRAPITK